MPSLHDNTTTFPCFCSVHCSKGGVIFSKCFSGSNACYRRANAIYWYLSIFLSLAFKLFTLADWSKIGKIMAGGGGRSKTIGIPNIWYAVKYNCKISKQ